MNTHTDYFGQYEHGEGYFEIEEYELYYRRFGSGNDVLLALHGGPGMPHDYLAPLAQHAGDEMTVYLYDQFGVGRSDTPVPGDFDQYSVKHYREEVEAVRRAIDPDGDFHIYGQSWGGMLAQEYLFEHGEHVEKLILANTLADTASAYKSMRNVLNGLSEEAQDTIEEYESARAYTASEYETAIDKAYREHVCRTEEYPDPVTSSFDRISADVYGLMWGPNEYVLLETARLRDWDVRNRLSNIETDTLVLSGEYDEISSEIARGIADQIPQAEIHVFNEASHMPYWEVANKHYEVVEAFLNR